MRGREVELLAAVGQDRASAFLRPRADQLLRFELLTSLLLGSLVLIGVLFYVWQHIQVVRLGYEVEQLEAERIALLRGERELRFELARFKSLRRVEEIARSQLGLMSPASGQVILAE